MLDFQMQPQFKKNWNRDTELKQKLRNWKWKQCLISRCGSIWKNWMQNQQEYISAIDAFDLDKDNFDRRLGYWKLFSLLVKHQRRLEMYKCCTWWKPNIWVKSPACQLTQEGYYFKKIQSNVWMLGFGFCVKFSWGF